jgi:hypothetical protein
MATPEDNVDKGLFEQDPHVDQLRPEPSAPPSDVVILEGLAGKSDREGWVRLYFNRTLTYYAEFRREDIVFTQAIPPDQSPLPGLKATRVGIKKDAVIEYTRTTRARAADEFDLDVRLGAAASQGAAPMIPPVTRPPCDGTGRSDCIICRTDTCDTKCTQPTCPTSPDHTCNTCNTCDTKCTQPTCPTSPDHTCNTCQTCQTCNTCQTCPGRQGTCLCQTCPGQGTCETCQTCDTQCHQGTCGTCDTCNPHVFTCGGGPQCR